MKKLSLIISLALIVNLSFSQEMKTLFKKDTSKSSSYGGYGAPMVGTGMLDNNFGITIGAKGGMIKNHHFGIGGIGGAIIGNKSTSISDTVYTKDSSSTIAGRVVSHNLTMGYGGIFIEYIFNYSSPIHVSLPLNIEVGGVWGGNDHSDSKIKTSSFFMLEPGINFEFNFSEHFVPAINVGYRYVTGAYSAQLSGLNVGLVLKIGKF